ncbi:MAG TPA: hypothetical protein VNA20_15080 [Frankiaceae bacterium]|nr:hypothetical protein [Frankiaceae bacterium]
MLAKTLSAAVAVAALAAQAPLAAADPFTYDCDWVVQIPGWTLGQQSDLAFVEGTVQHGADPATIRCYVRVNGVSVATTPTAVGATAAWLQYPSSTTNFVELCAEATTSHGTSVFCF